MIKILGFIKGEPTQKVKVPRARNPKPKRKLSCCRFSVFWVVLRVVWFSIRPLSVVGFGEQRGNK